MGSSGLRQSCCFWTRRRELASLRDPTAQTLAEGIKRNYVAATDVGGQPLFKLTLNSDCDHYFRTVALSDQPGPEGPQISSERRLADARYEFHAYLTQRRGENEKECPGVAHHLGRRYHIRHVRPLPSRPQPSLCLSFEIGMQ